MSSTLWLAACCVGIEACGASFPQTVCASDPSLTTAAEVDACRNKYRDAGADVMHAVLVDATPPVVKTAAPTDGGHHGG